MRSWRVTRSANFSSTASGGFGVSLGWRRELTYLRAGLSQPKLDLLNISLPARNPQTSRSEPKDAPLQQVCLDGFHGTRRGPHKRNTVCSGAHAPQLQARLVESRAASLCARIGRVAKHQQHRHSACRSSRGVASSARGHRAHREAPRTWFVNLFPFEVPERGVDKRACSPSFLEEFFSETEHIPIRCGESRRRAGSRREDWSGVKCPDPLLCLEGAG